MARVPAHCWGTPLDVTTPGSFLSLTPLREPELRAAIGVSCPCTPGARVLDAGCGSGVTLKWLAEAVLPTGVAVGLDLAAQHTAAARAIGMHRTCSQPTRQSCAASAHFRLFHDAIWCQANTINHLSEPIAGLKRTAQGSFKAHAAVFALAQSSLLPEMYFCLGRAARGERCNGSGCDVATIEIAYGLARTGDDSHSVSCRKPYAAAGLSDDAPRARSQSNGSSPST